jgi:conjugal transfer pilus assembly protein TraL
MLMNRYTIPAHLDDPELIGFWTLDEFLAMIIPFTWGVLAQHIVMGVLIACACWWFLRKMKAGRAVSWIVHTAYWYLPGSFMRLRATPPSHLRLMAG